MLSFVWQCVRSENSAKPVLSATYKRICDAICLSTPALAPFTESDDAVSRTVSLLLVLRLHHTTQVLVDTLDRLKQDLAEEEVWA